MKRNCLVRKSSVRVPSCITVDENDKATLSSISTDMDRKTNMQRSLARNKKQVQAMNLVNKKNQTKINQLTEKLNEMNQQFIKEKKATNTILESSRIESAEALATAKSLIHESRLLKRAAEEIKQRKRLIC